MIIERTKNEVIFKLLASTSIDFLEEMSDLFELKESSRKSLAKLSQVDDLVKAIKKGDGAKLNPNWVMRIVV